MKILYFTDSYPYGLGEQWKTNEINILSKFFDDIEVIPFHYGSNQKPVPAIVGVKYNLPLFETVPNTRIWNKLYQTIKSKQRIFFLREFLKNGVINPKRIKQWLSSSYLILELLKNDTIKDKLLNTTTITIAYFFWGRKTAEIIPLIDNTFVKSFVRLHGYDLYKYRYDTHYIPFQSAILERAFKVLTVSENGKDYLNNEYPNLSKKLLVSRLGTIFSGEATRSMDGILRIFSCSSLIPLKRVSLIASALKHIKHIPIKWTHIGDGPCLPEIEEIAKNFSGNINFIVTGWVNSSKVISYYLEESADLFVNVSETEGVPVSIMEAMSAGIPVFATNVGGVSEIVNNRNGKLLDKNIESKELANIIIKYYDSTDKLKVQLRTKAFETYTNMYDAIKNAEELSVLFKQISE